MNDQIKNLQLILGKAEKQLAQTDKQVAQCERYLVSTSPESVIRFVKQADFLFKETDHAIEEAQALLLKLKKERPMDMSDQALKKYRARLKEMESGFTSIKSRLESVLQQSAALSAQSSETSQSNTSARKEDLTNQQVLEQKRRLELAEKTQLIQERDKAIEGLHKDAIVVNELMTDISRMIQDQGKQLEDIEGSINITYDRIEGGVDEIRAAEAYLSGQEPPERTTTQSSYWDIFKWFMPWG